jgi:FKBP-type peptidyl-prolyl cis-trans isomerase
MRLVAALALAASLTAGEAVTPPPAADDAALREQVSYQIGVNLVDRLQGAIEQAGIDKDAAVKGINDALAGKATKIPPQELQALFQRYDEGLKEGRKGSNAAWLAENGKKKDITTTASGLQYQVVKAGAADGKKPTAESNVKVHYRGTKLDGSEFDSSYKRGQPAEFALNQVIKGWTEGLQLMSEGSNFTFWIPSELAYGEQAPPSIGANQILKFEVELLEVKSSPAAAAPAPAPKK